MTRKDTILIAVVINAGLLAVLFLAAVIYDTDKGGVELDSPSILADNTPLQINAHPNLISAPSDGDEVDNVLKYYAPSTVQPIALQTEPEAEIVPFSPPQRIAGREASPRLPEISNFSNQGGYLNVIVKKGDMLEKIARANKTTVGEIMRANNLESERLSIGQVLKVPLKPNSPKKATALQDLPAEQRTEEEFKPSEEEPVYYVVKSGDNPWKIAKHFGVKYDEILRLNHLDEEKARNLKIGDRIRVK